VFNSKQIFVSFSVRIASGDAPAGSALIMLVGNGLFGNLPITNVTLLGTNYVVGVTPSIMGGLGESWLCAQGVLDAPAPGGKLVVGLAWIGPTSSFTGGIIVDAGYFLIQDLVILT
jgi:hypothetical protein